MPLLHFLQYFSDAFPTLKEQLKFEETLFRKTHKANGKDRSKGGNNEEQCWLLLLSANFYWSVLTNE